MPARRPGPGCGLGGHALPANSLEWLPLRFRLIESFFQGRRPVRTKTLTTLVSLTLAGASLGVHAETRYYDPSNTASSSGMTTGYELYRTIGCPGKQLLDPACAAPPAAKPAPQPKPKPRPR